MLSHKSYCIIDYKKHKLQIDLSEEKLTISIHLIPSVCKSGLTNMKMCLWKNPTTV